ncbi:MAG TPA: gamma-glutamyl-gamma-aminobutyrate hydrolase family protein [Terriglobia bacterium]|nr:gamma-glutamyl-gamma-aminobutyrate hydrolase family protein [Terriglobia bacterium]
MAKPWIGIPTRFLDDHTTGKIRLYLEPVLWAGGLPVMIPTFSSPDVLSEYLTRLDGILLPGSSSDIDPARYGEAPHPRLGKMVPDRDALDFALLEHSDRAGLPVLGICFGAQSLNVFRGGTLIQDIPSVVQGPEFHDDHGDPQQAARHRVRLGERSRLARLAGSETVEVNSFHHQSVGLVGASLRTVATAPDGVIEAIEDVNGRFVVGVQWHPERGFREDAFAQALFAEFVQEAGKSKSHRLSV